MRKTNENENKKTIAELIESEETTMTTEITVNETAVDGYIDEADMEVFEFQNEVNTGYAVGEKQADRPRCVMYTQRLDFVLKIWGSLKAFEDCVRTKLCTDPKDTFAYIIQDKDISKVKGQQYVLPHIHLALKLKEGKTLTAIATALNDYRADGTPNVQTLTIFKRKVNNMFSYLCHRTTGAKNKYQYSFDDVVANFDYKALMEDIAQQVDNARKKAESNLGILLELLKSGEMTMKEVCEQIPASTLGACWKRIENVNSYALALQADKWREEKIADNRPTTIIWLCGASGTGKSRLGRQVVKSFNEPYYIAGSSRGIWERYQGEHIVLLDELRPNCIESYRDLLSILDNYQERAVAPSRYNDKELMLDVVVVTSVLSPYEFYLQCVAPEDRGIDPFHQLERRISACIIMEDDWILNAVFDEESKTYVPDMKGLVRNVYSEYNNPDTAVFSSSRIFNEIVHRAESVAKHYAELNKDYVCEDDTPASTDIEQIADEINDYESAFDDDYDAEFDEYDDMEYYDEDDVE